VLLKYCESDDSCVHWFVTVTESFRVLRKVSRLAKKQTDDCGNILSMFRTIYQSHLQVKNPKRKMAVELWSLYREDSGQW
jgi:hypothetical protein